MEEPPLRAVFEAIIVSFLIMAHGFFVAAETALLNVKKQKLKDLAASGNRLAKITLKLAHSHINFLPTTQLGMVISGLALGYLGEKTFSTVLKNIFITFQFDLSKTVVSIHFLAMMSGFAILIFIHILIGKIVPRAAAIERSERVALLVALPIKVFYFLSWPFIWSIKNAGELLVKSLGLRSILEDVTYTEEDIKQFVTTSHTQGHLVYEQQEMIQNIVDFKHKFVKEIMVPRPEIVGIEIPYNYEDLVMLFSLSGYSRIPIFRENLDNILGIVYAKDLIPHLLKKEEPELSKIVRKPLFIPAFAELGEVLQQMRSSRNQIAIVVDEHGGVEGLITMEDLLEQIVGEINDEHDPEKDCLYKKEADGTLLIDGTLSIKEVNRILHLNIPESDDYTTIAGFLMAQAGRVLNEGETVEYQSVVFSIYKVDRHRLSTIKLYTNMDLNMFDKIYNRM